MALEHNQIVCPYCGRGETVEKVYEEVMHELYTGFGSFFDVVTDLFCQSCNKQIVVSISSAKIEFTVEKPLDDDTDRSGGE